MNTPSGIESAARSLSGVGATITPSGIELTARPAPMTLHQVAYPHSSPKGRPIALLVPMGDAAAPRKMAHSQPLLSRHWKQWRATQKRIGAPR
jgi:hypothetical protein